MQVFRVGQLEVIRVLELEFPLSAAMLAIGSEPAQLAESSSWAKPHFVTEGGDIVFALTTTCVVSDEKRIVIDPCLSFDLRRGNPDIADRASGILDDLLPAAGFAPEQIDLVLNTHIDGVGWNVRPGPDGWRPAFPKARNVFTRAEVERVLKAGEDGDGGEGEGQQGDAAALAPLIAAGAVERVESSYRATSEISFRASPGHTPGNVDIWIESEGESAVVVGDHLLNPMQCKDPDWTGLDMLPDASPGIRRALLEECAERNTLMIGPHFGSPGAGRVLQDGDTWRLKAERSNT